MDFSEKLRKILEADFKLVLEYLQQNPEKAVKWKIPPVDFSKKKEEMINFILNAKTPENYTTNDKITKRIPVWRNAFLYVNRGDDPKHKAIVKTGQAGKILLINQFSKGNNNLSWFVKKRKKIWEKIHKAEEEGDEEYLNSEEALKERMNVWLQLPRSCNNKCPIYKWCRYKQISHIKPHQELYKRTKERYGVIKSRSGRVKWKWESGKCALFFERAIGNRISEMSYKMLTGEKPDFEEIIKVIGEDLGYEALTKGTFKEKEKFLKVLLKVYETIFGKKVEVSGKTEIDINKEKLLEILKENAETINFKSKEN